MPSKEIGWFMGFSNPVVHTSADIGAPTDTSSPNLAAVGSSTPASVNERARSVGPGALRGGGPCPQRRSTGHLLRLLLLWQVQDRVPQSRRGQLLCGHGGDGRRRGDLRAAARVRHARPGEQDGQVRLRRVRRPVRRRNGQGARRRGGDHWANGHWSVSLPKSMQSPSSRVVRLADGSPEGGEAEHDHEAGARERDSTLLLPPGAMFTADSPKGRARRLAAQLARLR